MKKFIKKIVLSTFAVVLACGFSMPVFFASAEEIVETPPVTETVTETPKNGENLNEEHSFESFLEWSKNEAEKYGYGNEYENALKAIEAAASKEQVTLSTIMSSVLAFSILAYIVYKKIEDKKFKNDISNISKKLDGDFVSLIDKIRELVDGTNNNTETELEIKKKEEEIIAELNVNKKALKNLINAFMHFSDGIKLKDTKKAEVQRDCLSALEKIDKKQS